MFVAACLLGAAPSARVMAQEDVVEEFDCETYLATAPVKTTDNGEVEQPYLTLDTNDVKTWNLGASMTAGFACSQQLASCCCRLLLHFRLACRLEALAWACMIA